MFDGLMTKPTSLGNVRCLAKLRSVHKTVEKLSKTLNKSCQPSSLHSFTPPIFVRFGHILPLESVIVHFKHLNKIKT